MPSEFFKNPMHSRTSSCSTAQATIDEHTLATMSMYIYSHRATPSLTRHLQISSFNAPDLNPGAPLTLAAHCHASQPPNSPHKCNLDLCNPYNLTIHTQFNLQGLSVDQSMVTKTTSNG
ncbi:uncharacterized protein FOMMEDRAFT_154387 [Fomitiporia mediterranea MF3/22]|uniref:uncharacterized protein n=1 Tax=Fomitiporia mediterranea (strain MF3/22) TaxID=694068 RepID=UPI0004407A07|nr:uncharacterized protein FOMMEDRAFT_154387 [Fomitiporia mediterranea MF3/22]EJD05174.1 hypothetical protein FOMMEDRAFT_154387 [Fomitiporia mediterranea MF3/22]